MYLVDLGAYSTSVEVASFCVVEVFAVIVVVIASALTPTLDHISPATITIMF